MRNEIKKRYQLLDKKVRRYLADSGYFENPSRVALFVPGILCGLTSIAILVVPAAIPVLSSLLLACVAVFLFWTARTIHSLQGRINRLMKSFEGKVVINSITVREKPQAGSSEKAEGKKILYH